MVLINLDSLPKANSPNTKHVYRAMAASSLGALFSLVEEPGLVGELGPVVSVINRFQSSYFGKENFSGVLKSFHQPPAGVPRPSARPLPLKASETLEFPGSSLGTWRLLPWFSWGWWMSWFSLCRLVTGIIKMFLPS